MNIGPLVVPHTQTTKLIQPRKRPFHYPPPTPQATAMFGAAHGDERENPTCSPTVPDRSRVVATIADHTVRPLPWSAAFALQRRDRIYQRQGFWRIVSVRAGQAHRERHTPPVADQMALAPALGPIGGIRTGLVPTVHRADGTAVDNRPRPINLVIASEPIQQCKVDQVPDACLLPVAHPTPAGHPRPTPEFLREHLPGDAAAEHKQNASETRAIRDARPSAFPPTRWSGQERFDKIPQRI